MAPGRACGRRMCPRLRRASNTAILHQLQRQRFLQARSPGALGGQRRRRPPGKTTISFTIPPRSTGTATASRHRRRTTCSSTKCTWARFSVQLVAQPVRGGDQQAGLLEKSRRQRGRTAADCGVREQRGNSWGYDPAQPFAVDNVQYGEMPGRARKPFVQACHLRGIAVLLDVVHNHYRAVIACWTCGILTATLHGSGAAGRHLLQREQHELANQA